MLSKIDNIYHHLPIVTYELDGLPYPRPPGALADFIADGGNFYLKSTDDAQTFDTEWATDVGDDYPGCSDDANDDAATEAGSAITIDGFAPASAYPEDYNSQVSSWIAVLASPTSNGVPPPSGAALSNPTFAALLPPSSNTPTPPHPTRLASAPFILPRPKTASPTRKTLSQFSTLKMAPATILATRASTLPLTLIARESIMALATHLPANYQIQLWSQGNMSMIIFSLHTEA